MHTLKHQSLLISGIYELSKTLDNYNTVNKYKSPEYAPLSEMPLRRSIIN